MAIRDQLASNEGEIPFNKQPGDAEKGEIPDSDEGEGHSDHGSGNEEKLPSGNEEEVPGNQESGDEGNSQSSEEFGDSDDDDLQQLVETLQSFVKESSQLHKRQTLRHTSLPFLSLPAPLPHPLPITHTPESPQHSVSLRRSHTGSELEPVSSLSPEDWEESGLMGRTSVGWEIVL